MIIKEAIKKLVDRIDLSESEAYQVMDEVLDGGATEAQVAAFLISLRNKGESISEITGCAKKMKEKAINIKPNLKEYIDCVGTGGDGTNTFNISTTAAFVIAATGVPIAKHGNRAISSKSGSADLLEALGININLSPENVKKCVEEIGIGFMFAKNFHPHMKTVAKVRSELNIRTIFNILGPISNPSGAKYQVVGVYNPNLTHPIANAMLNMGVEKGMVISDMNTGMDEFSTFGETKVSEIKEGKVIDYIAKPEDFGIARASLSDIKGGSAYENREFTLSVLQGEKSPKRDIVVLNAACAIYAAGKAGSIKEGIEMAEYAIDSNKAYEKMLALKKLSGELAV